MRSGIGLISLVVAGFGVYAMAQQLGSEPAQVVKVVQGTLISLGSTPFHLKAEITEDQDQIPKATVEMFWLDAMHWRRAISSGEFSQTLIVNGDKVSEQDSTNYFPLDLWSISTAMVDPAPILAKLGSADQVRTKANGLSSESGVTCFDASHRMCMGNPWGLDEFVGGAGHSIEFSDYHPFHGKRIARRLVYLVSVGDFMTARVTELEDLRHPTDELFAVGAPGMAHSLGGGSPLHTRQGEVLAERQGCPSRGGIWRKPQAKRWPDEQRADRGGTAG